MDSPESTRLDGALSRKKELIAFALNEVFAFSLPNLWS
jgi:hypothetical protein